MTDPHTFEHRKALLQLSELLNDDDSKKIVYVEGLPKMLEEKSPWEVLAHLEVQGKTTVEELTRILKAINRHDAAKKAKELIGKPHRRKKVSGYKALMLEDSLDLAMKHCKILIEQVDYLKVAANKDGSKRIEEVASEAMRNLTNHVQHKLKYALLYFSSQNESSAGDSSSSPSSSPESSRSAEWPSAPIHSNPHPTCMHIKDTQPKKVAEKHKQSTLQRGSRSRMIPHSGSGVPTVSHATQLPSLTQDAQKVSVSAFHQERENPYTLPAPIEATGSQNATPIYENYPIRSPHPPSMCSKSQLEIGSTTTTNKPLGAKSDPLGSKAGSTTSPKVLQKMNTTESARSTDDVSSTDDYSCSTCSYTGDSGFSDSRVFMKESPPSLSQDSQHTPTQKEHGSKSYTPLIAADVRIAGYYTSLNRESIQDVIYANSGVQSSNKK